MVKARLSVAGRTGFVKSGLISLISGDHKMASTGGGGGGEGGNSGGEG